MINVPKKYVKVKNKHKGGKNPQENMLEEIMI